MEKKTNPIVVLIAGMVVELCIGIIYMWSIFQKYVVEYFNYEPASIAYTASVMLFMFVIGILVGGRISDKKGPKIAVLLGILCFSVGIFLSSLVNSPILLYLTYGVIGGFGVGSAYTAIMQCAQGFFPHKRGFATGMIVCAFGASVVVFTPVAEALLKSVGVASTFQIMAGGFLVICFIAWLFIKNPEKVQGAAVSTEVKQYTTKEILKTPQFYFITISMMLITPAYFIINPLVKQIGELKGLSPELALFSVMLMGIASTLGRLVVAWLSDKMGRKNAILMIGGITLISAACLTFATGPLFLLFIAGIAFSYGGTSGVYPTLTTSFFGTKHAGSNYGAVMMGFGVSAVVFPYIAGAINSTQSGDYTLSFLIAAGVTAISIIAMLLIKPIKGETKS